VNHRKFDSLMPEFWNFASKRFFFSLVLYPLVLKNMYSLGLWFAFFFFCFSFQGYAQVKSIGTPGITNYPKSAYDAGTQNWGISQDKYGFIYFANNDGVLRFDGLHWDLTEVSRSSPVRSVFVNADNQIYCGLFNDFGMLRQNESGRPFFYSLRHLLPDNKLGFDDIWKIHEIADGIVFQSFDYLFLLADNKIEVIKPKKRFHFSFHVNGRLFLHEPGEGLFEYINGNIDKVPWADELKEDEIWAILEIKDNDLLIGTRGNGIYKFENGFLTKWQTPVNELVKNSRLFSATIISETHFVFGTILNGLVISDIDGNIVQHINRNKGLQNNTILSIYTDRDNNLWLGLDNGIDYIEVNSPVSYISDHEGLGTGYCCEIFQEKLYLGTNQGLFVKSFRDFSYTNENFELIENTTGQVWSLDVFDDQLICGHNSGTYLIRGREALRICDEEGGWKYIRPDNKPDILIGGHYYGLVLLRKNNNEWNFYKKVKGFNESSRFIFQEKDGTLWISHGGKGVFSVHLNEEMDSVTTYRLYTEADGLPSNERNILFTFDGNAFISGENGIYKYQKTSDSFKIYDELDQLLSLDGQLLTLETDNQKNIWFIAENESGVIRRNEDMSYTKITFPFKQLDGKYVNGFEFVYPLNNDHVFFGLDNGFAHYSPKILKSYAEKFSSFITRIEMPYIDSTFYFNPNYSPSEIKVPFPRNAFRFHYSAPFFESMEQLRFSYFLENYSEDWSDWSADRYRDFTNLPEGDYTLRVKAKNIFDTESEVSAFSFTILPPWYRSKMAYYAYLFLLGSLIFILVKLVIYRIEKSKERQRIKHDLELQRRDELFSHQSLVAEKEIIRLRNEKLRDEMIHRDKELANQTMGIIQKNKFLMNLKEELHHIQKHSNDSQLKSRMSGLSKRINKEIDNKQQNQLFETYFDEVHQVFFEQLKQRFPQLSPREMRLSAFIRMNLTSKEIAALLNITDRGVEISRYRLRKKLELPRETNLSTFLSNI
jgi:ligand-binding sensor domain-containing protein/DNA-binding CsgD family transcriptional regulator